MAFGLCESLSKFGGGESLVQDYLSRREPNGGGIDWGGRFMKFHVAATTSLTQANSNFLKRVPDSSGDRPFRKPSRVQIEKHIQKGLRDPFIQKGFRKVRKDSERI